MCYDAFMFLTDGFEETEAIAALDVIRRGGIPIATVSITGSEMINGAHGIVVKADALFGSIDCNEGKALIFPGGPGTDSYFANKELMELILKYNDDGKYLAAICAAPKVFASLGLLEKKRATCFPSFSKTMNGAVITGMDVELDGNIITSKAMGTSLDFGLEIVKVLRGGDIVSDIRKSAYIT